MRLAFGLGQFAEGVKSGAFNFFLLFYYNQVLGLSGALAGQALLIALVFDAVSDPVVGSFSDSFRSRLGRRHPFMYAAAVPFGLAFYGLFNPPDGLSQLQTFAWLATFSVLARTAMTFYSVPHMSLGAELTADYAERTALSSVRAVFGLLGSIATVGVGFSVFFHPTADYANGQLDPAAYPPFAAIAGLSMVVTIWLSAAGTHHTIPWLPRAQSGVPAFRFARVLREYADAFRLRAFRFLFGSLVSNYAVQGVLHTLSLYVLTFFWKLSSGDISLLMMAGFGGMVAGAGIAGPFARLVGDKGPSAMLSMAWWAVFTAGMVTLRLLGLAPENGDPLLVWMILVFGFIGGVGNGAMASLGASMIADVTDDYELRYGDRQEGIFYGSISFAAKAASGIGTAVAGIAIDVVGLGANSDPETVPASVVDTLGFVYGPAVVVAMAIPVLLMRSYDIDRDRHRRIRSDLEGE